MLQEESTLMEETYNFSEKANYFETTTDIYQSVQKELHSVTDVITLILCSCVIIGDTILILSILLLEKLRSHTNCYVFHFAIFNCLYFIVTPPFFIVFEQTAFATYYNSKFLCTLLHTERTCLNFCFLFASGLCFHWLISSYSSKLGHKYSKVLKYLPYLLYITGLITFLIELGQCVTRFADVSVELNDSIYFITLFCCTLMNIIEYKFRVETDDYISRLAANFITFPWLPLLTHKYLFKHTVKYGGSNFFKWMLETTKFLCEWPAYSSALGVFIVFCMKVDLLKELKLSLICQKSKNFDVDDSEDYEIDNTFQNSYSNVNNCINLLTENYV